MVKIKNKKGGNPDLYANHITILCSIAFLVIGAITIVVLCRLPQTALVKFIDNISYFVSGFSLGIAIYPILNHFKNLIIRKE